MLSEVHRAAASTPAHRNVCFNESAELRREQTSEGEITHACKPMNALLVWMVVSETSCDQPNLRSH